MDERKVEVGVKEIIYKKKLVGAHAWAGYVKKGDEKLAKRADAQKLEGKWRRERSKLRWGLH